MLLVFLWVAGAAFFGAAPDEPAAHDLVRRGVLLLNANHPEEARKVLTRARRQAPEWSLAHLYWAMAELTLAPKSTEALAALRTAVRLTPDNPRISYHLGLSLKNLKRWSEAAAAFGTALTLRPGFVDARFWYAVALRHGGRDEAAIVAFEQVLKQDIRHVGALAALAELYEKKERLTTAESLLIRIARLQPGVAYHRYRLASFYTRTGQKAKAREARALAEEIAPRSRRKMRSLKPSRR